MNAVKYIQKGAQRKQYRFLIAQAKKWSSESLDAVWAEAMDGLEGASKNDNLSPFLVVFGVSTICEQLEDSPELKKTHILVDLKENALVAETMVSVDHEAVASCQVLASSTEANQSPTSGIWR